MGCLDSLGSGHKRGCCWVAGGLHTEKRRGMLGLFGSARGE